MSGKSDFNTPVIALVGFVSTILTIAIILGVHVLYYSVSQRQFQEKVIAAGTAESDIKVEEQKAKLTRYAWSNKADGVAVIPIEQAMELVVRDANQPASEGQPAHEAAEESAEPDSESPDAPAEDPGGEPAEDPGEEPAESPAEQPAEEPVEAPAESDAATPESTAEEHPSDTPDASEATDADSPSEPTPNEPTPNEPAEAEAPEEEQSDEG